MPQPEATDSNHMDVDDDEEDPLDAFMSTVTSKVAQVNEDDRRKAGTSGDTKNDKSKAKAVILGQEDSDAEVEDQDQESDELDRVVATEDLLALAAKKIKKKELATVDHSSMDYEPFRKVFYHPPSEIQDMSEELANQIRLEMDAITVRGKECPKPLTKVVALRSPR